MIEPIQLESIRLDENLKSLTAEEAAKVIIAGTTLSAAVNTFENYIPIPITRKNNLNKKEDKIKNVDSIKFNKPIRRI